MAIKPETAVELVGRYARLTLAIKDCKRRIGAELDKCKGLKGFRLEVVERPGFDGGPEVGFLDDFREPTQRAINDQDTHLKYWYEKPGAEDDWGEYRRYVISDDEADECPHCYAAHLIVRERKAMRLQLGHVKGAMTRLGALPMSAHTPSVPLSGSSATVGAGRSPVFFNQPERLSMHTIIKPTIGRRIWYWPPTNCVQAGFVYSDASQPLDAGVAYVHSDRLINISVADQTGVVHSRTSVLLCQEGDTRPEFGGYCEWMNYQIGQAARAADKAEAA